MQPNPKPTPDTIPQPEPRPLPTGPEIQQPVRSPEIPAEPNWQENPYSPSTPDINPPSLPEMP